MKMQKIRMNPGDSPIPLISMPSIFSAVWAQFLPKTDTKDTKTTQLNLPTHFEVFGRWPNPSGRLCFQVDIDIRGETARRGDSFEEGGNPP
jgi:hypothetical protein